MQPQSNHWQLQEAKAKFSHLVNQSVKQPQFISKHGKDSAVLISIQDYQKIIKQNNNKMHKNAFGLLAGKINNPVAWQQKMRTENDSNIYFP